MNTIKFIRADMLFHASTQREHWLFREAGEVQRRREAANQAYRDKVSRSSPLQIESGL